MKPSSLAERELQIFMAGTAQLSVNLKIFCKDFEQLTAFN